MLQNLHNVDFQKLCEIIIDENYNYENTAYSRESLALSCPNVASLNPRWTSLRGHLLKLRNYCYSFCLKIQ